MVRTDRVCTCQRETPIVDITEAFSSDKEASGNNDALPFHQLRSTLQSQGWGFVQLHASQLPADLSNHASWKRKLHDIFEKREQVPRGIYRRSESGSSEEGVVEPKESWEVQRSGDDNGDDHILFQFLKLMHELAVCVRTCLGFPKNVLLQEDGQTGNTVDLLRAFYYHTVPNNETVQLGSSEHTDWGSFTVVWQDDTGGLETFCHSSRKWNPVPPAPFVADKVTFVVHVSDVTSLAIGLAASARPIREDEERTRQQQVPQVKWPSPRHRVVSPLDQTRVSLVYFAYPSPAVSIQQVAQSLATWTKKAETDNGNCAATVIPFEDYFLLQNQASSGANGRALTPKEQFESIADLPLGEVLANKWAQVQRGQDY